MATSARDYKAHGESFGRAGVVVTPGAGDLADGVCKGLFVAAAGDVTFVPDGNDNADTVMVLSAPVGLVIPFRVRRVTAATATVVAVYD